MKKFTFACVLLLSLAVSNASAESKSYGKPGEVSGQLGLGLSFYGFGLGYSVAPGVEVGITKIQFTNDYYINIGIAARGFFSNYTYEMFGYKDSWNYLGLGGYGIIHWSPLIKSMPGDFVSKFDYYTAFGLEILAASQSGTFSNYFASTVYRGGIGLGLLFGVSYEVDKNFSLYIEEVNSAGTGSIVIGVKYKIN